MAGERTVIRGIVLRSTDTKESDKILTVLTAAGKLTVIAKGARGRKSRVTACTQLGEGATIALFEGVRRDIVLLSLASYFAELTEAVALEDVENGEVLSLLLNALYALGELKKPPELVKAAFELKLMSVIGFAPLADACAYCGRTAPEAPLLDIREGVVRCKGCGKGMGGLSMPLSDASLAALRRVLYGEAKRLYSFKVPQEDLKKLADAAEAYVHAVLERGFKTLDFYKGLVG